jgi:flagellar hook-length control protein FliK
MLAMLGQISGAAKGTATVADADGGKVSADGAASGRGKASGVLLQAMAQDGQAGNATPAASAANLANALGNAVGTPAASGADAHKDRALDALALATSPTTAATPATQTAAAPPVQLSSTPGSAGFAGELGQQVVWFAQQGVQQAKVRLHPEDLGSLDVKLSVSHGRVDVVFSAQHPAAVTAVQQSLPQLDQLLSQHGLALGHAEVGQQQSHGHGHARGDGDAAAAADEAGNVQGATSATATASRIGLLDAFA